MAVGVSKLCVDTPNNWDQHAFICGQNSSNNGSFFFRTVQRNDTANTLTPTETRVKEIRFTVNGSMIKCEFTVPNLNASNTRSSAATTFSLLLGNGSIDGSNGALQPHAVLLLLSVLALSVLLRV
ncbi:hypothetical protein KUCAC02_018813 [Chaenocephalus aceratus]|uniref:Uncharacterized protein n=1 Tax=Chaenocephalus aceratus TaxID=36190 RepID=A0ACB9WAK1_CHAAC|nr:hypothetical protein KUCAC02_018813 [Chaenocephalus aceratus]